MRRAEQKNSEVPVYTVIINPPPPPKPPKEFPDLKSENLDKGRFQDLKSRNPYEEKVTVNEVAKSALKLEEAKKITLGGNVSGAVLFDGSEDVTLKATVKVSTRALNDGNGNTITETYARKSELKNYAAKEEINKKINYLESVIYATKEAVNESLREKDLSYASAADIADMFGGN